MKNYAMFDITKNTSTKKLNPRKEKLSFTTTQVFTVKLDIDQFAKFDSYILSNFTTNMIAINQRIATILV